MFVGRDTELELLARTVQEGGRLVLISGEPGIGKTRLAEELARHADARVAWGRTWEGDGTPAFWPWIQILRQLDLAAALDGPAAPVDPAAERFRRFDAVLAALLAMARARPLVLVLDDLHAADAASIELLAFVARGARGTAVSLIATARDTAPARLAPIAREAVAVPLARLGAHDVARWVDAASPARAGLAGEVFAISEGNPLFVAELLVATHKRPDAAWRGARLPTGIRDALRAHLALVRSRGALEAAAIAGRDFDARDDLDDAVAAGVVVDLGHGRMRFAHALLRDEVLAAIEPARLAALHRAAAATAPDLATAAHHWLAGAGADDVPTALAAVRAAMREAERRLAFEDAADVATRAIAALALAPEDACQLEIEAGELLILGGRTEVGRAACFRAAERATQPTLLARAALAVAAEATFVPDLRIGALLERALAALPVGDDALRARVMGRLALAMMPAPLDRLAEQARLRDGAIVMARRLGDDAVLLDCLLYSINGTPERMPPRERFALNAEAIALAERTGRLARVVQQLSLQVVGWFELGDPDGAAREAARARAHLRAFPQPHYHWRASLIDALLAVLDGRFAEAVARNEEGFALAESCGSIEGLMQASVQGTMLGYVRGDLDDLEHVVVRADRLMAQNPLYEIYGAIANAMFGRRDEVARALALARAMPREAFPGGGGVLGWPCVQVGAIEHAGWLYDLVADLPHLPIGLGPDGFVVSGPNALLLGRLAALLGRRDAAAAHYADALALAERLRWRPYVAQAELAWAELGGDGALDHARRALELARALAMRTVAARAEAIVAGSAPAAPAPVGPRAPSARTIALTRHGATWTLAGDGRQVTLRDGKGLGYLAALVDAPHREVHVLELVGVDGDSDAGPLLDERARRAYRARAEALRDDLEEATARHDLGRAERARVELDALAGELARGVGLGGRERRAGSLAERARINVQRRLRVVIQQVAEHDAALARHLELSVKTGVFCMYAPTWP